MDNKEIKQLNDIIDSLNKNILGQSLRLTRSFVDSHPYMMYDDELDGIERDYKLMLDYMKRGFNDPQRESIYINLTGRLYHFVSNLYLSYKVQAVPFYSEASRKSINQSFSNERIKNVLENFVTDIAMLSLEPEGVREQKSKEIYRQHNEFIQALFCYITVSRQWNDNDSVFFENMLLSPTIDSIDTQVIISALTLATMNSMDINKFNVLINVYQRSTDERIRQRALIGWIFSLSSDIRINNRLKDIISDTLRNPDVVNELADLQKQIIFCMNAEQDNDKIQRDIMPELIKNNNLNITRFGITEKEEDPMADVFDPGASDRAMEKMEESFQKMMSMQKAGSDIYFGGFSQMKRFPFFYNVANWFCPFYIEHPEISGTADKLKGTPLLANILSNGPFCDSDKYSFTLAISSVINHLPDSMREMFNTQEAFGQVVSDEDQKSPAYIRRMILQDMYRFFRLFPQRSQLVNPFDTRHFVFVSDDLFQGTDMRTVIPELCYFMLKHKNKEALKNIIMEYNDDNDPKCMFIHGIYELDFLKDPYTASAYFEKSRELESDNKRALLLLARSYFESEDYDSAAGCYESLHEAEPENKTITLNYSIALSKAKRYEEAVNMLYKLDFENPGSMPVIRVLAWTLMGLNKLEQAEKEYYRLLGSNDIETGDWLNAGYCQWFMGKTGEAVSMFKTFIESRYTDTKKDGISDEFEKDYDFLKDHKISNIDIRLMTDLLYDDTKL